MIGCDEVTVTEPWKLAITSKGPRADAPSARGGSVRLVVPATPPLAFCAVNVMTAGFADGLAYATPVS